MRLLALLIAALSAICAGEALPPGVAARVGTSDITLRQVEESLLKKEGAEQILQWVQSHLDGVDWAALGDDDVVMSVAGHQLRRRELAFTLLQKDAGKVREELVNLAVVEQALAQEGVIVDDTLLAIEFRLMERRFQAEMRRKGQGYIDFASYLRVKEKQTVEQFLAQGAIHMMAGIHELVRRRLRVELGDAQIQARLDADRARYDIAESVELEIIFIAYDKGANGIVDEEERARRQTAANIIRNNLAKGQNFGQAWQAYGKAWDPVTDGAPGRVGWVDRQGHRQADANARVIPKETVERAFAAAQPYPQLLPLVIHDAGVDIVRVTGHRPARKVELPEVRERIINDVLEAEIEQRTNALLSELRRKGPSVSYGSLPELLKQRGGEAKP